MNEIHCLCTDLILDGKMSTSFDGTHIYKYIQNSVRVEMCGRKKKIRTTFQLATMCSINRSTTIGAQTNHVHVPLFRATGFMRRGSANVEEALDIYDLWNDELFIFRNSDIGFHCSNIPTSLQNAQLKCQHSWRAHFIPYITHHSLDSYLDVQNENGFAPIEGSPNTKDDRHVLLCSTFRVHRLHAFRP